MTGDLGYDKICYMSFTKGHPFYKGGEKGWFKKGIIPWSKSQKGVTLNTGRTHFKKGIHSSLGSEFKIGDKRIVGENNTNWKGDNVGYFALHSWVLRKLGQARKYVCKQCGESKNLEWANISHLYRRDIKDWMVLCKKCHHRYDKVSEKLWETRRKNGTDKYKNNTRI